MFTPIVDNFTIYQAATFQRIWQIGTSTTDDAGNVTFVPTDLTGVKFYAQFKATQSLSDTAVISLDSVTPNGLTVQSIQTIVTDPNGNITSTSGSAVPAQITLTITASATTSIILKQLDFDLIGKSLDGTINRYVQGVATISPAVTPDPSN
jgi:hypothetical protein